MLRKGVTVCVVDIRGTDRVVRLSDYWNERFPGVKLGVAIETFTLAQLCELAADHGMTAADFPLLVPVPVWEPA